MPVAGGAHMQGCKELRENLRVKVGIRWVPGPGMDLCLQHNPGSAPDEAKAADCAHSILCLGEILQQKISLLNCMKTKPSINLKYFDARSASHSFSSLAIKWHQQWTQTLWLFICHQAHNTPPRQGSLCSTNQIPKVMGDYPWQVTVWQVIQITVWDWGEENQDHPKNSWPKKESSK